MTDIERKPLPWFAFNVADYIKDTMRLTTESHGAYLLLMLDYYGTATPCPDDDFVLAAVAKLPVESWKKHRKVLEPFFDVREGHWFHRRIEAELLEACSKHAASSEKARNAALAKHEKRRAERGISPETPGKRIRSARSILQAAAEHAPSLLEACSSGAQTQTHTTPFSRSSSDDDDAKAVDQVLKEEDQTGTFITEQFRPTDAALAQCLTEGTADEISLQVRLFKNYNRDRASLSTDWNNTWDLWWSRHIERRTKDAEKEAAREAAKAPARVEVNVKPYEPTEADYDRAVASFARGIPWSYKSFGAEPGQIGCRVPPALLEKHGIDPKTGFKRRREPVT